MKRSFSERLLVSTVLAGVLSLAGTPQAYANPTGGQVVGGAANISNSGNTLTVQQTTSRAIINWSSFDIGPGEIDAVRAALKQFHRAEPRDRQ